VAELSKARPVELAANDLGSDPSLMSDKRLCWPPLPRMALGVGDVVAASTAKEIEQQRANGPENGGYPKQALTDRPRLCAMCAAIRIEARVATTISNHISQPPKCRAVSRSGARAPGYWHIKPVKFQSETADPPKTWGPALPPGPCRLSENVASINRLRSLPERMAVTLRPDPLRAMSRRQASRRS
jgi:hypothetical protein